MCKFLESFILSSNGLLRLRGDDKPTRVDKYIRVLGFVANIKNLTKITYLRRILDASTDGTLVQPTTKLLDCCLRNKDLLLTKIL